MPCNPCSLASVISSIGHQDKIRTSVEGRRKMPWPCRSLGDPCCAVARRLRRHSTQDWPARSRERAIRLPAQRALALLRQYRHLARRHDHKDADLTFARPLTPSMRSRTPGRTGSRHAPDDSAVSRFRSRRLLLPFLVNRRDLFDRAPRLVIDMVDQGEEFRAA